MSTLVTTALRHNTSASNNIILDSNGRVGIGTAAPAARLDVNGAIIGDELYTNSTTNALELYAGTAFNTGGAAISIRGTTTGFNNHGMEFYTGGAERMRIDASGRITNPSQPMASGGPSGGGAFVAGGYVAPLSAHINVGSHMNTTTGVFTAPVAGRYFVYIGLLHNTTYYVYVHINSGATSYLVSHGTDYGTTSGGIIVSIQANDTIRFNTTGTYYNNSHGSYAIYLLS